MNKDAKDKLYTYRVLNRLSQHDMAVKLEVSQPTYSLIETGKKVVTDDLLHKINNIINER